MANNLDENLLKMLVCPESKMDLAQAGASQVKRINELIAAKTLKNKAGRVLEEPVDGLLIRKDNLRAYPIWDNIPVLLIDESIDLNQA